MQKSEVVGVQELVGEAFGIERNKAKAINNGDVSKLSGKGLELSAYVLERTDVAGLFVVTAPNGSL